MCWVVNIMCWVSKRLLGRHHHVLGRPRSLARHSLPSRAPLLTRHPPRPPVILRRVGNLSRASLQSRQPAGPGPSHCEADPSREAEPCDQEYCTHRRSVTWFRHLVLLTGSERLFTSRNKRRFMSNVMWKNAHSCDRLTSQVSSHQMTSFLASKMPGKATGTVRVRFTSKHERGENQSERQVDMVLCAGAAARRAERGLNFIV